MYRKIFIVVFIFCSPWLFSCDKCFLNAQNLQGLCEVHENPELIFECYKAAYPDKIENVVFLDGDWAVELFDGKIFFWANGRILPESKRANWENYIPYDIYPYTGQNRDPKSYSLSKILFLREAGSVEARKNSGLPQDFDFFNALFDTATRASTETHIATMWIFGGCKVNVHEDIQVALRNVDKRCMELAKTDEALKDFIENVLIRVDGYHWRLIAGTDRLSNHSFGLAIDVIPPKLDDLDIFWSWIRDESDAWMLFPQEDLWAPPQSMIDIFTEEGFVWGGTWDFYDNMHFEYRPELVELGKRQ